MLKAVKSKVLLVVIFILIVGSVGSLTIFLYYQNSTNKDTHMKQIEELSNSIFLSLRDSMNSVDSNVVKERLKEIRNINGVSNIKLIKSKLIIDEFDLEDEPIYNPDILEIFKTKKQKILKIGDNSNSIRILKPLISRTECLGCHTKSSRGDVLGVMDLEFTFD